MFQRLREARLLWSTLATIVAFAILLALGSWQWQRMQWKAGLLRELEHARSTGPVSLPELITENTVGGELQLEKLRFRQVRIETAGPSIADLFVWDPQRDGPAWSVVQTRRLAETVAGYDHVLVVKGTVPEKDRPQLARDTGTPGAPSVTGRVRLDAPNPSAPAPVPARSEWFTRDFEKMTATIRQTTGGEARFLPFFLEATGEVAPPLRRNNPRITLANRHFEYALTWWGLAATLIGVYVTFVVSRLRGAS